MKNDFYYPSKDGITTIHAIEWIPEEKPRAVLQLCHGMCEYINRYDEFAQFMCDHGFAVVGNDHLGHGESVQSDDLHGYFADKDGNLTVLRDVHTLRKMTEEKYPGVPYFILGHSMGSFLIRQYIARRGKGLSGAIIMGTGSQPTGTLRAGMNVCRMIAAVKGWHHRSETVHKMSMGAYNKRFAPARTKCDWLTKDTAFVDAFIQDPWCTFRFTLNAYYNMFSSIEDCQAKEVIDRIPKELPMLLVAGQEDPVGDFGKGVETAYRRYRDAFPERDLTMKLYENDRHEILNETDRQQIFEYLLHWTEMHM